MPRQEQTVAYGTETVIPSTAGRVPKYATTGIPAKITDSLVFAEGDEGQQVIIGLRALVKPGQVDNASAIVIGEDAYVWGLGGIAIGEQAGVGQVAAKDGAIAIGYQAIAGGKNQIRIGSGLAFGAAAGDDSISIGTQANASVARNGIAIGRGSIVSQDGIAIGHTASTNGTTSGIAIGKNATAAATGVNHFSIAIGEGTSAGTNNTGSAIAIGHNAVALHALGMKLIAIGDGAVINVGSIWAIALGAGATNPGSNEVVIGDSLNGNHVAIFTIRAVAGAAVRHRMGPIGWEVATLANAAVARFKVDELGAAGDTAMLLWDVTQALLLRVSLGAANSESAGFRNLRVVN